MIANAIARRLEAIQQKGALRSVDVAKLLSVRPETVSRWNQGKAFPHPDAQRLLLSLEYIVDQLSDFYEPREARLWIYSPQELLGAETPAKLIQQGRVEEIMTIVDQLREGIYV